MAENMNILVGTIGQGVMKSADGGDSWRRVGIEQGLHSDAMVRTLASPPNRPQVVFAGTDKGLYRSDDVGEHWGLVDSALNDYTVWALAIDPRGTRSNVRRYGHANPGRHFPDYRRR